MARLTRYRPAEDRLRLAAQEVPEALEKVDPFRKAWSASDR
jgi:hypothetical protein